MKKQVIIYALCFISALSAFGQRELQVTSKKPSQDIFRQAGENETVVEVYSSVPSISFTSNMDKEVKIYEKYQDASGFYIYKLKFPTDKSYKNKKRKLTINAPGFIAYTTQTFILQAKVPIGFLVIDPEKDIYKNYSLHLEKGDELFQNDLYEDAIPEYQELLRLISQDTYAKERIASCEKALVERKTKQEEEKRIAEKKAAEEKALAELKARQEEEKRIAEQKAAEERRITELKAKQEEEKRAAEQKAVEEKRIAEQKEKDAQLEAEKEKKRLQEYVGMFLKKLPNPIEFDASGGEKEFKIVLSDGNYEILYDISELPLWCSMRKTNISLILTCEPNLNANTREGYFTIQIAEQFKKVLIKQKKGITLTVSSNHIEFDSSGEKDTLTVSTNAASWEVLNLPSWCTIQKENKSLVIIADYNASTNVREGNFYIQAEYQSINVTIKQKGITSLEKGNWKQAIKKVIHNGGTHYKEEMYKGEMSNKGSRNGLGVYFFIEDEDSYWGSFLKGESSGKGIYIIGKEGDYSFSGCRGCKYYAGNWSSDIKNGFGRCYDKTGKMLYSGYFQDDKPMDKFPQWYDTSNKFECIEYDNGNIYLGETQAGINTGLGILFLENGDAWYGEWEDGKRNGDGIEYQYSGSIKTGRWINDTLEVKIDNIENTAEEIEKPASTEENEKGKQFLNDNPIESKSAKVSFPETLTRDGKKVYLRGKELSQSEVRKIMTNTDALHIYNKGISNNKNGNGLITCGTLLMIGGGIMAVATYFNDQKENKKNSIIIGSTIVATGTILLIPGIALKISSKSKIRKAVDMYNNGGKTASAELKCNFTGNGIHFSMVF